jgi:hypothetical protein
MFLEFRILLNRQPLHNQQIQLQGARQQHQIFNVMDQYTRNLQEQLPNQQQEQEQEQRLQCSLPDPL